MFDTENVFEGANIVAQRVSVPFTRAIHSLILQLLTSHQSPLLFLNNVNTREWVTCDRPIQKLLGV